MSSNDVCFILGTIFALLITPMVKNIFNLITETIDNIKIDRVIKKREKQKDPLAQEFEKVRYKRAYDNKLKLLEEKIEELKKSGVHYQIAEQLAGSLLVKIADFMVEADRMGGKIDNLYSKIE